MSEPQRKTNSEESGRVATKPRSQEDIVACLVDDSGDGSLGRFDQCKTYTHASSVLKKKETFTSFRRLIMEYLFIVNIFKVIVNVNNVFYKLGQI